ncbi:MAG: hypothetical protein CVU24_16925 [Betaproteobacteria bacterium HGW-Betaproteobacteria-18]|nr:MAG: hypothetical protein CVU24_16925 [Betaproteobacteria bacterium HGW-Betaproteobacteria-18]
MGGGMKFQKDGRSLTLESEEEVAEFNKLVDLAKSLKDKQHTRAEKVFKIFIDGNEVVDFDDENDSASISANLWCNEMDAMINQHLDHRSISDFVGLIVKNHVKALQVSNAYKRHAENRSMKADVFVWLDANMVKFRSMDSAAEAITKQQPIAFRTAREWAGEWKKLRSTGTP